MKYVLVPLQTLSICVNMPPRDDDHKLRLFPRKNLPTAGKAVLAAVPDDWRDKPDPFENARQWETGSLPSFRDMGAVGKAAFGGVVIYPDTVYRQYI